MSERNSERVDMNGGRILAEALKSHGVGVMFGMGGFQLLPFYEAIRALGLRHHLINDERCGAFAADAYARVSGRVGVCDGTLGPGALNLVTALVESLNAGVPIVAIIGDTHRQHSWKNMTQETRQTEILRPACKEILRVESVERIVELVGRAFSVATAGRPGPVVLDIPEDVCHAVAAVDPGIFQKYPEETGVPAIRCRPDAAGVEAAARLLAEAERPLILAGGGIHLSRADGVLTSFAETFAIPVAHTMSGKGALACTSPLSAGLFGRYSRIANDLIGLSDCLLVVGCKLGEIATRRFTLIPPATALIHIDVLPEEFGRTTEARVKLWGDAGLAIADIGAAMAGSADDQCSRRAPWIEELRRRMAAWRAEAAARAGSNETPVNVARLVEELNRGLPAEAILIADGGFAAHWTGLFYDTKRSGRSYVADRGLASIGYGLPGAIGAKLAEPERPVVALTGDGGFNMTLGELETARRAGAAVTVCVVNNAASGYVKALQHAVYGAGHYQSSDLSETDFAGVARALGCRGIRVERPGQLAPALAEALAERALPTVIDIITTRDPAGMLPGVDNRALVVKPGDRPA